MQNTLVAFFYCTFTDSKKQNIYNLICSCLLQLARGLPEIPSSLMHLYNQHQYAQPSIESLKATLRSVLERSGQSFLVIDALDECVDENGSRTEILALLNELSHWALPEVHILVTSRKESDIDRALNSLTMLPSICIQTQQQSDITLYIRSILATDSDLLKWTDEVKEEIAETLIRKAFGM